MAQWAGEKQKWPIQEDGLPKIVGDTWMLLWKRCGTWIYYFIFKLLHLEESKCRHLLDFLNSYFQESTIFPSSLGFWSVNTANLGITLPSLNWVGVGSDARVSVGTPGGCTVQGHPLCHGLQACLQGSWNLRVAPPAPNILKNDKAIFQLLGPLRGVFFLFVWLVAFFTKSCRGDAWHGLCFTTEQVNPAAGLQVADSLQGGELTVCRRRELVSALKLQVASGGSYTTKLPPLLSSSTWKIRQPSKKN